MVVDVKGICVVVRGCFLWVLAYVVEMVVSCVLKLFIEVYELKHI